MIILYWGLFLTVLMLALVAWSSQREWKRQYEAQHTARLLVEQQLLKAQDDIAHLEHEYNPEITDARTAQYVKVLDTVRQNINLDMRTTGSESGMMLGGKPWAGPGGDNQGLSQLARGGTAGAVEINRRVERVHDAMKQLAAYFGEEDPCPCSRCVVNRTMKERGMPATMSGLMAAGQIPKMPDIGIGISRDPDDPDRRSTPGGKFDLPTPIDPDKLRGDS